MFVYLLTKTLANKLDVHVAIMTGRQNIVFLHGTYFPDRVRRLTTSELPAHGAILRESFTVITYV